MGSRCDRKRMNVDGDRLSSLSDDLIHKILSFVGTKDAMQTSALSSRWRYIWTSIPGLDFSTEDFDSWSKFSKFVKRVLSGRNNQIDVSYVVLTFRGKVSQDFVKRILNYAFSHNVQQLCITCLHGKNTEFPFSLISSRSFKHLTLKGNDFEYVIKTPPTLEMPALTTLNLHCVTLYHDNNNKCAGIFSKCANLKNLTLTFCIVMGLNGFNICHPGLSSLTLENTSRRINVVTPQLINLTIRYCGEIHLISTPNLSSMSYRQRCYYINGDDGLLKLSTDLLHLEEADICIKHPEDDKVDTHKIACLFQHLRSVKFLKLNLELIKLLSSSMELISLQPSPFVNLKSLQIYPDYNTLGDQTQQKITMSTEVKKYLLDGSPSATLTMVSLEESRAVMNVTSARNLIGELQELLDEWKENCVTKTAHVKQDKAPMTTVNGQGEVFQNHSARDTKMKCHSQERRAHIERYWEVLNEQLQKGYEKTRSTISLLRGIEGLLEKVPISDRDKLQARFSGLRAEAETIMDNVMDRVKIQWDK